MRLAATILALALALPAPLARAQGPAPVPTFARPHRLAVTFGFGVGSASLGRLHELVKDVYQGYPIEAGYQINAEVSFRYYFPYHLLAQVGCGGLYNWAKELNVKSHNVMLEVPILVGGYHTFIGRLYVYGALGPSIFFFPRAWLDEGPDFSAPTGAGLHVLAGTDLMVGEHFALGLELRFRYLRSGDLMYKDYPYTVITENLVKRNGSSATYDLDFTGVSLALNLRFFAL
jgi:hypothetical protein